MIHNELFMPRPAGATDFEDSPVCAALESLFGEPKFDPLEYFHESGMYRRCPNTRYKFSRDQFIGMCVVLAVHELPLLIDTNFVDGRDIMPPSVTGHVKRCKGFKASWFEDAWLWGEIWVHAKCTPRKESNQLILMMMTAEDKFLKYWCDINPHWRESIIDYWISWRNEPEMAARIIAAIEIKLSIYLNTLRR